MQTSTKRYLVGVDVGTGSARAGLFTTSGKLVDQSEETLQIWNPRPDFYQQSSNQIWRAACASVKEVITRSNIDPSQVIGIGFDATCSLVALDTKGEPVSISLDGENEQNVVMWMDHRAGNQAERINQQNHPLLRFVGGKISVEMEPPKICWLKENIPNFFASVGHLMDLCDYLTFRATGNTTRSLCSVVCKWLFSPPEGAWSSDFWTTIGLKEVMMDDYRIIGNKFSGPGSPIGSGLTEEAAISLGLPVSTPVAIAMIDAYAGTLGCLGCSGVQNERKGNQGEDDWPMVIVAGTSACHMMVTKSSVLTPGVWGPYEDALLGGVCVLEGGQSAAGTLLTYIQHRFPSNYEDIPRLLETMRKSRDTSNFNLLTRDIHICPDFHGNRSPDADPEATGMISGLTLDESLENCALIYLATVQALAYGTRRILKSLNSRGVHQKSLTICGGLRRNTIYTQIHADVTGLPVLVPNSCEPVLLGAAMLANCAAGKSITLKESMESMCGEDHCILQPNLMLKEYHNNKYDAYCELLECQKRCRDIMANK